MSETPAIVRTTNLVYLVLWLLLVGGILLFGERWERMRGFRARMIAHWPPALAIAALFALSFGFAGRGFFNLLAVTVFCQALIGLALAGGVPDFEPLPVLRAFKERERPWRTLLLTVLIAVLVVVPAVLIATVGLDIGQQIFGETDQTGQIKSSLEANYWTVFWMFFGGAGIAEETPFRLALLTLLWRLTGRRNLAVLLAAILFGVYHLTPLNGMYQTFLQYPVSQFLASTLIGIVWGLLYVKRGYGAAVLAHTLSNWLPFVIFVGR